MKIVIDNDIWCDLEIEEHICKYKFWLLNIPCGVGGHKKTGENDEYYYWHPDWRETLPEVVEGVVVCDSNEGAMQCANSIRDLIESGYRDGGFWLIGMDMTDLLRHFNGEPMKFLHKAFADSFDERCLQQIKEGVNGSNSVCYHLLLPEQDSNEDSMEVYTVVEKIFPDNDAQVMWQLSIQGACDRTISTWYR